MANGDTRRLKVIVTGDSGSAQQAVEQVGSAAEKTESKLAKLTSSIIGWGVKGAVAFGAIAGAAATMGIKTAAQLEQVSVGFTTMLGSGQKAQKFMKELQDFANKTPFEFTELTSSAQQLLAMGFSAKKIIPMLRAVGDAVAAMGGTAENVDSIVRAFSQMQAKGKIAGDELMQLTEQGVPALQLLADGFHVSTTKMQDMITKGLVPSSKAIPILINGLENGSKHVKGFAGMMDKQSETMNGKWSTLMDTMQMGLGNIAMNFLPAAKKGIDTLSSAFGNFFAGIQGKGPMDGFKGKLNEIGLGVMAMISAFKEGDVTSDGLVGKFELMGVRAKQLMEALQGLSSGIIHVIDWLKEHNRISTVLIATTVALIAVTKTHAIVTGIQAAGGLLAMFKNLALVQSIMKVVTAVQWAYNGAVAAASYLQIAGYLGAVVVQQKLMAVWTKIVTAAQWLWDAALAANPIGLVVIAIAAFIGAIILLWKHSDGFQKWVKGVLWPSLQKAWTQLKDIAMTVANAVVAAWNFIKNGTVNAWNATVNAVMGAVHAVRDTIVGAFTATKNTVVAVFTAIGSVISTVVGAVLRFFQPLINVFATLGGIIWGFYTAVWKIVWILIQIAVKVFIAWFQSYVMPAIAGVMIAIAAGVQVLKAAWDSAWHAIMAVVGAVVDWFNNTIVASLTKALNQLKSVMQVVGNFFSSAWHVIQAAMDKVRNWVMTVLVPSISRAWAQLQAIGNVLSNFFGSMWNSIKNKVSAAISVIAGPIIAQFNRALNTMRGWLNAFRAGWNIIFDAVQSKVTNVMNGVIRGFQMARDGIKKAWDAIQNIVKAPVNFVVNSVYNDRIRPMWNGIAEKFGVKTRLDTIKGFARGGTVGSGYGTKDDQPAMLTRGEGILTTKEMKKLGGKKGFNDFRAAIAQYNSGGIVGDGNGLIGTVTGWGKSALGKLKDIVQGIAGPVVRPLVNAAKGFINDHLATGGVSGLMRSGGNTMLDKLMSWVTGKDKEMGSIGGAGGAGMGWKKQQALISAAFPGLSMISGFRQGATTLSGNQSYHALGRAVDYPPNRALALWIRSHFGSATKELITPWNELNLHNGKPHKYTGAVWNQHNFAGGNAHDHWAMDTASTVQPGWFTGYNGTGKPETLVNSDKIGAGVTIQNLIVNVGSGATNTDAKRIAKEIRDELLTLSRRNGGRVGLPKN